jgi:hypothetical protein
MCDKLGQGLPHAWGVQYHRPCRGSVSDGSLPLDLWRFLGQQIPPVSLRSRVGMTRVGMEVRVKGEIKVNGYGWECPFSTGAASLR